MPDPRGGARLEQIGCEVVYGKSELKFPVEIKDYEDFVPGTRYPKMKERKVWFVQITIPIELMDDIKEGTIDIADQTIDLSEIEDAYNEDLDDSTKTESSSTTQADQNQQQQAPVGASPMM
jgi:hypothetical protein